MTTGRTEQISYRAPVPAEFAAVRAMARTCFDDTFGHLYERVPYSEFLDSSYGDGGSMATDLADPGVQWLVGFDESAPVGYAKVVPLRAPAPAPLPGALELQQIYVLRQWHGHGVAARLMEWAIAAAEAAHAPEIYLTVFEHNERAKAFYTKHGFAEVGRCEFRIGNQVDQDRVWRRAVTTTGE